MIHSEEKILEVLEAVVNKIRLKKAITDLSFRADYEDFVVILDDDFHCEIREKLLDNYIQTKSSDFLREIRFRLEHATEYEEWEKNTPPPPAEEKTEVDDSDKYDF